MRRRTMLALVALALALATLAGNVARAEPAFAVRTGYRCGTCHENRTGGGIRTAFGSVYTQTILPQRTFRWRDGGNLLPADPDARFNAGADFRGRYLYVDTGGDDDVSSFEVAEANLYLLGRLLPGRLNLYLDETVGPGGAAARELFALIAFGKQRRAWIKAGKFLPNYGWRLPDDDSFIRNGTGFAYSAPDTGVEFGIEPGRWTITAAAVNGEAGGGSDGNDEKKFVAQVVRRFAGWRVGVSGATNIDDDVRTTLGGVLAGVGVGRLALLAEYDVLARHTDDATRDQAFAYFEANLLVHRGLNLKYVHDWIDPDRDQPTDARTRDSLGVEWIPWPFVQLRAFVRTGDGPPQVPGARADGVELELHLFF